VNQTPDNSNSPTPEGFFGAYGGQEIPPELKQVMDEIYQSYNEIKDSDDFKHELHDLQRNYVGRPSPVYFCRRLSAQLGGAEIYLKREDLNHTGAHKINHCLGEALLAKKMGKTKILAETGAGQHGVALSAACALVGIECEIHMGAVDIAKQAPNVTRMKIMGATVVGPHPFPQMVRDFQQIVGMEARQQFQQMTGELPNTLVACVGGGSNAIGILSSPVWVVAVTQ